ncbi:MULTISPECIES: zf-TFIIB domain-containing protein [Paracoccaceae]|jgi:Zn-finger nucleic acid-binding protein|uniref:zf-TFIIB domain-containing protein n=1 Tax=Paracoccaceae TaxID=31989 RepID=UPI003035639A
MQCPVDGTQLQMMERQGVEIDYCPKCRGVWLDRGELDKIIERATPAALTEPGQPVAAPTPVQAQPVQAQPYPARGEPRHDRREDRYRDDDGRYGQGHPSRRRKSFLSEIFDFD